MSERVFCFAFVSQHEVNFKISVLSFVSVIAGRLSEILPVTVKNTGQRNAGRTFIRVTAGNMRMKAG